MRYAPGIKERAVSALAAALTLALLVWALISGLAFSVLPHAPTALVSIDLAPPRPEPTPKPPVYKPKPSARSAPKGAPAPPALRNRATPVAAPIPKIVLTPPPPIVVATRAATGAAVNTGASDLPGPGQGARGIGDGFGGGGYGGDGDGGGRGETGPRQIRGRLAYRDLPDDILPDGGRAEVGVRFVVAVDGRVTSCEADEPSGYPALDRLTCRLIMERFRYRPALDGRGRPVRSTVVESHGWFAGPERRDDD